MTQITMVYDTYHCSSWVYQTFYNCGAPHCMYINGGFLTWGLPPVIIQFDGIFHEINPPAIGYPHNELETPVVLSWDGGSLY